MRVLLPPSEGKSAPTTGPPLNLEGLSLPQLTAARTRVLDDLTTLCRADPDVARATLGLSATQSEEVTRDAALRTAPAAPAGEVYSGVLYEALGLGTVSPRARARLERWVLVWSGLFGVVHLTDRIPAYRLSGSVSLPGVGRLASYWRTPLADGLAGIAADEVVLDLRSGTYASTWTPPADSSLVVRVVHEASGTRRVASHANKATKGRLVRALAEGRADPSDVRGLLRAIRSAGFRVEGDTAQQTRPQSRSRTRSQTLPRVVDVVVESL